MAPTRSYGGANDDTFSFDKFSFSTPGSRDVIRAGDGAIAFEGAGATSGDRIDLAGIDAVTGGGDQAFQFGTGTGSGHLWLTTSGSNTIVNGNIDGDAAIEFQVVIEDGAVAASAYTAADFIL